MVTRDETKALVDEMERRVKQTWYDVYRREGVSEKDCAAISSAFAYEGFRYKLQLS